MSYESHWETLLLCYIGMALLCRIRRDVGVSKMESNGAVKRLSGEAMLTILVVQMYHDCDPEDAMVPG